MLYEKKSQWAHLLSCCYIWNTSSRCSYNFMEKLAWTFRVITVVNYTQRAWGIFRAVHLFRVVTNSSYKILMLTEWIETHTHTLCHSVPTDVLPQLPAALKIELYSSPPGQKTSLTQETELLESLLQEVEHQVGQAEFRHCALHTLQRSSSKCLWCIHWKKLVNILTVSSDFPAPLLQ